eukprot:TRINITY_DN45478_c0_g1_i1.p1 TRINITY_DN45478_c0_g1~~TRINITY_DN45478_c0_g1_i1.p1  ORF type:complete len:789 (-),score=159.11 TRINITY_DN45478_c0_g1_i1:203-2539(-)
MDWIGYPPLLIGPRRPAANAGARSGRLGDAQKVDGDEEDESGRNRQKELQDICVAAEDPDLILATARELDGGIVISTALHRLGKLGLASDYAKDPRFGLLLEKFKARLPFFGSRQIANSMHGLGSMLYREGGPWVEMVSIQTQRRIHDFEPQHVSNTLWACARMQCQDPLMLRALVGRAIEDIPRFCPLDVSIVTWALATLRHREVEWLRAVVRARCEFADFSPQNMSNFVWGLATLGFRNDNMVLAVGREAARKIQDFIPQELSNYVWALATMSVCDNLMLRAVAEEVERRADILHSWDPQSMSNMMWAYATLAVKDDPLFLLLLEASVARIADHDTQNLANSAWAAAMVSFRHSLWIETVAEAAVRKMTECQTLHIAQLSFAFTRAMYRGERFGLLPAIMKETVRRVDDFAPQSLFDVHDALGFLDASFRPQLQTSPITQRLTTAFERLAKVLADFAALAGQGSPPPASAIAAYRQAVEKEDIVTLGADWTVMLLERSGILCAKGDQFIPAAQRQIGDWRAGEAAKDPTSRSVFHRAQCAWQLGMHSGQQGSTTEALADGIFESGAPIDGGPEPHGLYVCRLRHPREGDAEVQALCAALKTSALRSGRAPPGLRLNLHLSDLPCVSCLGATMQFNCRHPGVLKVSFDRGRILEKDTVPVPRPPPPPSKKGNPVPYAPPVPDPQSRFNGKGDGDGEDVVDRSMLRKEAPKYSGNSFYGGNGQQQPRRTNGAAMGGQESVPHKNMRSLKGGGSVQTFYFSKKPDYYTAGDYDGADVSG